LALGFLFVKINNLQQKKFNHIKLLPRRGIFGVEIFDFQSLQQKQRDLKRIQKYIPLPETPGLLNHPKQPFQTYLR